MSSFGKIPHDGFTQQKTNLQPSKFTTPKIPTMYAANKSPTYNRKSIIYWGILENTPLGLILPTNGKYVLVKCEIMCGIF